MSAFVLIIGSLFGQPQQRASKGGKPFGWPFSASGTARRRNGGTSSHSRRKSKPSWRASAKGDKVAVQGRLQIGEYEKNTGKRVSLGVIADHVIALRQPTREKPKIDAAETG